MKLKNKLSYIDLTVMSDKEIEQLTKELYD